MAEREVNLITETLCSFLALSFARELPTARLQPDLQLATLLAFCRQNLGDPELSPSKVAAQVRHIGQDASFTVRALGQTFGRWMLDNRLDASCIALRDPNQRGSSISETAYRLGINDLSHFNRVFRTRFDQTPREWRGRELA